MRTTGTSRFLKGAALFAVLVGIVSGFMGLRETHRAYVITCVTGMSPRKRFIARINYMRELTRLVKQTLNLVRLAFFSHEGTSPFYVVDIILTAWMAVQDRIMYWRLGKLSDDDGIPRRRKTDREP